MSVRIQFLGATSTVTGSKYLVSSDKYNILVDGGLFQGEREWRERNWQDPKCDLSKIDAVLITHAHIDHTGILPRYAKLGLQCNIFCTKPTLELSDVLLKDSAKLQEEEAIFRAKKGKSRHNPPLPLYTEEDAILALKLFKSVPLYKEIKLFDDVSASWFQVGHIIGASTIKLTIEGKVIQFSGDVGRYDAPILKDPDKISFGDLLIIESTYGDRVHSTKDPQEELSEIINEGIERGGVILIPAFAVGRTQLVLYYLRELKEQGRIPDLPIYIDSPMARDATEIYMNNPSFYDEESLGIISRGAKPFHPSRLYFVRDRKESKELNNISGPAVIISASGMLSGGRILHHLARRLSDSRTTVVLVGYQPRGGRGERLKRGDDHLQIMGEDVPVRAAIRDISTMSAHADRNELIRWCGECTGTPVRTAVVHGEPGSAQTFALSLEKQFNWNVFVPPYLGSREV